MSDMPLDEAAIAALPVRLAAPVAAIPPLNSDGPTPANWVLKRYGYRVGSVGLLVGEQTRSEVVRTPAISPLPHSPTWLLGLMNLRGNLVPVADLPALCGAPPSHAPAIVLVLDTGDRAVAVPITALPEALTDLRPLDALPPLPPALAGHAGPAFEAADCAWLAFDHEQFFRAFAQQPGAH